MKYSSFQPESLLSRQSLFLRAFPENVGTIAASIEHYQWKFHSLKPATRSSYEYSAFTETEPKELVGYYAALPFEYQIQNQTAQAGMVCDVMTDPVHQGKGIFTQLGRFSTDEMKAEHLDFVTGYPIRPAVIPGHLKVGWKTLFKMPMSVRLTGTRTLPYFKKLPEIFHRLSSGLLQTFYRTLEGLGDSNDWKIAEHIPLSLATDAYLSFLNRWMKQQKISLQKSPEFLQWRLSAPGTRYQLVSIEKNNEMHALLITRAVDLKGVKTIVILDWMEDENASIPRRVLSKILRNLASQNQTDLIAVTTHASIMKKRKFRSLLLLPSPVCFTFILKNLSQRFSDAVLSNEKNWHLTWIDSDDL